MASNFFSGFSSPGGSEEDSAVEAIVAQAKDLVVLEHLASLNTAHISESELPTDLETRFRKLKSFPQTHQKLGTSPRPINPTKQQTPTSPEKEHQIDPTEPHLESERSAESKAKDLDFDFPPKSRPFREESPSPPRQTCCFWLSPKRASKKRFGSLDFEAAMRDFEKDEELLSDLRAFPMKEQRRILKKASKEEEKIGREVEKVRREAEKAVRLVRRASARIDVSKMDKFASDDEKLE
ncbi:hypothetical protein QJS04_geneDACA008972 [Acorus gramineus]|uniref:Uncharacterized protein n=1 Tax=Acorus gramineus TaxID=55184 RepID=A0AAV9ACP1_ACOGR|nr:hypothetical protein QJS04_geneDACA008972 [Acorus gramineus]